MAAYKTGRPPWHVTIGAIAGIVVAAVMLIMPAKENDMPDPGAECEPRSGSSLPAAVMTYLTRIGGHLVLSRFEHIHPRVEAGSTPCRPPC